MVLGSLFARARCYLYLLRGGSHRQYNEPRWLDANTCLTETLHLRQYFGDIGACLLQSRVRLRVRMSELDRLMQVEQILCSVQIRVILIARLCSIPGSRSQVGSGGDEGQSSLRVLSTESVWRGQRYLGRRDEEKILRWPAIAAARRTDRTLSPLCPWCRGLYLMKMGSRTRGLAATGSLYHYRVTQHCPHYELVGGLYYLVHPPRTARFWV